MRARLATLGLFLLLFIAFFALGTAASMIEAATGIPVMVIVASATTLGAMLMLLVVRRSRRTSTGPDIVPTPPVVVTEDTATRSIEQA